MVPKTSRKDVLDALMGVGRNQISIKLCKNNPAPADADVVLADLTQCDFDGYAALVPVWGAPALDGGNVAWSETGVLEWTAGVGLAGPQTIYGVYATIVDPLGGLVVRMLWFDRLVATVTLAAPGQKFRRICTMQCTNYAP